MTHKSRKISALIEPFLGREVDARYLAYFDCFNRQLFFEAHDVLEELWLARGAGSSYAFHKGLIQLAGAFVHLQKGRLRPAAALFKLAAANLGNYPPEHDRLDLNAVRRMIVEWLRWLEEAEFAANPLATHAAPRLELRAGW